MRKILYFSLVTILFFASTPNTGAIVQEDLKAINLEAPIYYGGDVNSCVGKGGSIEVGDGLDLGPLEDGELRRSSLIRALMEDLGLSVEQAAGIVGNFMHESGGTNLPPDTNENLGLPGDGPGNPPREVVEGTNTGGYGWAQWTGGRKTAFIEFAVGNNYVESVNVPFNDAANYAYLLEELSNGYQSTVVELKKQSTVRDSVISFESTFERAGNPAIDSRVEKAEQAFEEYDSGSLVAKGERECQGGSGSAAISGDYAFPLLVTKDQLNNPEMFQDGDADDSHPNYTAYDILVDPGTPVAAFMDGEVISTGEDVCSGRIIEIYNEEDNLTVSYLHLSFDNHVGTGEEVSAGDRIGAVGAGSGDGGCKIPHLHIDVVKGEGRPGCKRGDCPSADKFVAIGDKLFETFQLLDD